MSHPASTPLRLLVIDDDALMRDLLSLVLGSEGHTVLTAVSGDDALPLLSDDTTPDVILTDLQMPGLSGTPLADQLRTLCPPPVLIIGMSGSPATTEQITHFDAFLEKPFTPSDFARAVDAARARYPAPTAANVAETIFQPLDEKVYTRLAAAMPAERLREMYALCLNDAAVRLSLMHAAADIGDATAFASEAHAIKGGCGMLGASELHYLAYRMEKGALACTPLLAEFTLAAARLQRILDART